MLAVCSELLAALGVRHAIKHLQNKRHAVLQGSSRIQCPCEPLLISGHEIQQRCKLRYLGSMHPSGYLMMLDNLSTRDEVSNRIAIAANAWMKLSNVHT